MQQHPLYQTLSRQLGGFLQVIIVKKQVAASAYGTNDFDTFNLADMKRKVAKIWWLIYFEK